MDNERIDKAIIELQELMNAVALKSRNFGETFGDSLSLAIESLEFYKEYKKEEKYGKFSKLELLLMHNIVDYALARKTRRNRDKLSKEDEDRLISDYSQVFDDMKKAEKRDGTYIFEGLADDDMRKLYECTSDLILNIDTEFHSMFLCNLGLSIVRIFNILIVQEIQKRMDKKVRNLDAGGNDSET